MNRGRQFIITLLIMSINGVAIAVGYVLSVYSPIAYTSYKDLSIIIVAIPAAYFVNSFPRRTEYIKTLKDL
ncbi:hypothetical protein [Candidatus Nitrosocosmicus sp. SS]|uniref:hypothetical protein n=1 Tax=Candidatus Nitrosocosmicus agrestis TaxID=2563600 RepID=UPI00122DD490|nr:hypothetical protein [Candidatus Nitrosocosmicus sp. SS]KAA2280243.1 hypothetical protein F1Z66_11615 [Candidatus Nitrosocosmicus sp. SS]KAF0869500.1 hypothetical protein E5N71_04530 [Candidatus Nitrosocosmicus sp. SS]